MANGTLAVSQLEILTQSGTGIITVVPPATNTNRTLTLPDATGTVVASGTTPSLNGIAFPATQVPSADANTLDDYEEGTWLPALSTSGGNTFTQTGTGVYTKIGNNVTASGVVTWSAKSGTAGLSVSLPFATTSNGSWRGGMSYGTMTNMTFVSVSKIITFSLDPSIAAFSIRYANNGATWSASVPADMAASGEFQFSVTYPAA